MIPMLARIRVARDTGWALRLWVPLFVLWIIALPFVLIGLPFAIVACWAQRLNPWRTIAACWLLFAGMRGTHVEASDGRDSVLVSIY